MNFTKKVPKFLYINVEYPNIRFLTSFLQIINLNFQMGFLNLRIRIFFGCLGFVENKWVAIKARGRDRFDFLNLKINYFDLCKYVT